MNTISELGPYVLSDLMQEFIKKMIDKGYSNGSMPYITCGYLKACLTSADYYRVAPLNDMSAIYITQYPEHMANWIDTLPNIQRQQSPTHKGEMFT